MGDVVTDGLPSVRRVWYNGGMKTESIKFRLGPELKAELERQAEQNEMRLGEYVRTLLTVAVVMERHKNGDSE